MPNLLSGKKSLRHSVNFRPKDNSIELYLVIEKTYNMKMKITTLLVALICTVQAWSQGLPFSGVINGANSSITVNITYTDSVTGASGTFAVYSDSTGYFSGQVIANSNLSNQLMVWACINNCQGLQVCDLAIWVPGTIMQFNLDYCFGNPTDNDGDGYDSSVDCNDNNQWVYPGAFEECNNGIDNDCDGMIDEDCTSLPCSGNIYLVTDSMMNGTTSPFVVWVVNVTDPAGSAQYMWSTGDGGSMTGAFPTWQYAQTGTYTLCLYTYCANGGADTTCVTFTVDPNGGVFPGGTMMNGFTLNVVSSIPNAVDELTSSAGMTLFPNPAVNAAVLQWESNISENVNIEVYNVSGQKVQQYFYVAVAGKNQFEINVSELSNGMYQVVKRSENGSVATMKLTK
jgi:hypothetical protein